MTAAERVSKAVTVPRKTPAKAVKAPAKSSGRPPTKVAVPAGGNGDAVIRPRTRRQRRQDEFTEELLRPHAPDDVDLAEVLRRAKAKENFDVVVVAADIRKSTILMREAVDLGGFAETISDFVDTCRDSVKRSHGWFDKFTGDGFLAYWIIDWDEDDDDDEFDRGGTLLTPWRGAVNNALKFSASALHLFEQQTMPSLRRNSRNLPGNVGLSIGVDAGGVQLGNVAGDVTIVGPAVVGAVRMVTAASEPGETVANVYVGEYLERQPLSRLIEKVERRYSATKEYEKQEVYRLTFSPDLVTPRTTRRGVDFGGPKRARMRPALE